MPHLLHGLLHDLDVHVTIGLVVALERGAGALGLRDQSGLVRGGRKLGGNVSEGLDAGEAAVLLNLSKGRDQQNSLGGRAATVWEDDTG